jgi:hypothetical protein
MMGKQLKVSKQTDIHHVSGIHLSALTAQNLPYLIHKTNQAIGIKQAQNYKCLDSKTKRKLVCTYFLKSTPLN